MILEGNERGYGAELARHLLKLERRSAIYSIDMMRLRFQRLIAKRTTGRKPPRAIWLQGALQKPSMPMNNGWQSRVATMRLRPSWRHMRWTPPWMAAPA